MGIYINTRSEKRMIRTLVVLMREKDLMGANLTAALVNHTLIKPQKSQSLHRKFKGKIYLVVQDELLPMNFQITAGLKNLMKTDVI